MNPTVTKAIAAVIILGGITLVAFNNQGPSEEVQAAQAEFAQCLVDSGATFYGTFWCPHCNSQKALFGEEATAILPYVECSTPDGQGQTQECKDAQIQGYPTWESADGTRLSGSQSFDQLGALTGCAVPAELAGEAPADAGAPTEAPTTESGEVEGETGE